MRHQNFSISLMTTLAISALAVSVTGTRAMAQDIILHNFTGRSDGGQPLGGLIFDRAGNLYGTTFAGGAGVGSHGEGTVFELTPQSGGGWTETVLHTFHKRGNDGRLPYGTLIFDKAGNLYGTTFQGGVYGQGTVFRLSPKSGGGWAERVLHNFNADGKDGAGPYSALIVDTAGNLYGTTLTGGAHRGGTVFELTPHPLGGWSEKVIHSFVRNNQDGRIPRAGLILDSSGNLYGTTQSGGSGHCRSRSGCGTVFELSPKTGGGWTETILHSFNDDGTDGFWPNASLILDGSGNLYGTTSSGGGNIHTTSGVVFELKPEAGGEWTETILHGFSNKGAGGLRPLSPLVFDSAGNLYGTTYGGGGSFSNSGTVFELKPHASGVWTETVLYSFKNDFVDGTNPYAGLVFDGSGNFYGTTLNGGANDQGTVFEITP